MVKGCAGLWALVSKGSGIRFKDANWSMFPQVETFILHEKPNRSCRKPVIHWQRGMRSQLGNDFCFGVLGISGH